MAQRPGLTVCTSNRALAKNKPSDLNGVLRKPNMNSVTADIQDSTPSKNEIRLAVSDSANSALHQMAKYLEAENIKRQLGERKSQECYASASIQEYNEALPKPSKIPEQFLDDRELAASRVRSQYVDEVRESYTYICEQYDPVLRDRELDLKRQSMLEKKRIEDEIKRTEMRREEELDLARQELLQKKQRKKFKKKRRKKDFETALLSNESQAVLKDDETSVVGVDSFAPAPPCIGKQVVNVNDVKKGLNHKQEVSVHENDIIKKNAVKYANVKKAFNKNPDVCGYEKDLTRKQDRNEDGLKKVCNKSPDVQVDENEGIVKQYIKDCIEKAVNNKPDERVYENDVTRKFDVKVDGLKKTVNENANVLKYDNNVVSKLSSNVYDMEKDDQINANEREVRNDKIDVHRNDVNECVINTNVDTDDVEPAPLCGNPDWTPESMIQRIRRLNLKHLMGPNGTNTEPSPPKCDKPETLSYTNTKPAPPKCDKPETTRYNRTRRYKFIESEHTQDFVKNCNYVPTPPVCKPKEDLVSVAKNYTDNSADTTDNTIQLIKENLKAKGETELMEAETRKGCGGISYMIDTNTFRPSTSRREITRAHKEVVTGQLRRHEKPAVMGWNANTAKMKVGFKSKLKRDQGQTSGDKT